MADNWAVFEPSTVSGLETYFEAMNQFMEREIQGFEAAFNMPIEDIDLVSLYKKCYEVLARDGKLPTEANGSAILIDSEGTNYMYNLSVSMPFVSELVKLLKIEIVTDSDGSKKALFKVPLHISAKTFRYIIPTYEYGYE